MEAIMTAFICFLMYISIPVAIRYVILRKPIKRNWVAIAILVPIFIGFSVLINIEREEIHKRISQELGVPYKPSSHMFGSPMLYIAMAVSFLILRRGREKPKTTENESFQQVENAQNNTTMCWNCVTKNSTESVYCYKCGCKLSVSHDVEQLLEGLAIEKNYDEPVLSKETPEAEVDGVTFTNTSEMTFVQIQAGSLIMGSPLDEPYRHKSEVQHQVTLTRAFFMQTTEVTIGQWRQFILDSEHKKKVEKNDHVLECARSEWVRLMSSYWDKISSAESEDHPVTFVSWNDCMGFIKWLNKKENTSEYRLPTEAEWEYACRAGTTTPFNTGSCISTSEANYNGNYPYTGCPKGQLRGKTVMVASLPPNAWGLYNMHGNILEWCQDWYEEYNSNAVTDPVGPNSGTFRILRGGTWYDDAQRCRSASRFRYTPDSRFSHIGFRLVRDLPLISHEAGKSLRLF